MLGLGILIMICEWPRAERKQLGRDVNQWTHTFNDVQHVQKLIKISQHCTSFHGTVTVLTQRLLVSLQHYTQGPTERLFIFSHCCHSLIL